MKRIIIFSTFITLVTFQTSAREKDKTESRILKKMNIDLVKSIDKVMASAVISYNKNLKSPEYFIKNFNNFKDLKYKSIKKIKATYAKGFITLKNKDFNVSISALDLYKKQIRVNNIIIPINTSLSFTNLKASIENLLTKKVTINDQIVNFLISKAYAQNDLTSSENILYSILSLINTDEFDNSGIWGRSDEAVNKNLETIFKRVEQQRALCIQNINKNERDQKFNDYFDSLNYSYEYNKKYGLRKLDKFINLEDDNRNDPSCNSWAKRKATTGDATAILSTQDYLDGYRGGYMVKKQNIELNIKKYIKSRCRIFDQLKNCLNETIILDKAFNDQERGKVKKRVNSQKNKYGPNYIRAISK